MTKVPDQYKWLEEIGELPRMVQEGLKEYGTKEMAGANNSPTIMGWAKELGIQHEYTADAVPWCGLFMAVCAFRAGKAVPKHPLWALNWANFGTPGNQPCLGDVLTFVRSGGGHVAMYIGEDKIAYHVLGGNQHDEVCITRIDKKRMHSVRRPEVRFAHAATAKPYIINPSGGLSTNEA